MQTTSDQVIEGSAAAQQVSATTELLEAILLELPMRDLLMSQKVSKHWKAVWDGSVRIQRALYFVPAEKRDKVVCGFACCVPNGRWLGTPLIITCIPSNLAKCRAVMNPLLRERKVMSGIESEFIALRSKLLASPENASCRRMYISQPPTEWRNTRVRIRSNVTNSTQGLQVSGRGKLLRDILPDVEWISENVGDVETWGVRGYQSQGDGTARNFTSKKD